MFERDPYPGPTTYDGDPVEDYMPNEMYTEDGEIIEPDFGDTPQESLLDQLGKPFPQQAIKWRKGYNNKDLAYLSTDTVIRRLNQTAKQWSFIIKSMEYRGDLCVVVGSLTIPSLGTREGVGVQQIHQGAGGEDLHKGAASDALKKCAVSFSVGLELYGPDLEAEPAAYDPNRVPIQPGTAVVGGQQYPAQPAHQQPPIQRPGGPPTLPQQPNGYDIPTAKQVNMIRAVSQDLGMTEDDVSNLATAMDMNLMSLTKRQASQLIDQLVQRQNAAKQQ